MGAFDRYEINQSIRRILLRHGVDLTQVQYSTAQTTVYLFGRLQRDPEGEFTESSLKGLAREILRTPGVRDLRFELTNWSMIAEPGRLEFRRKT
jgi:hypothetical protein